MSVTLTNFEKWRPVRGKLVAVLVLFILPSLVFAQLEVKLKSGEKVQGKFISETASTLSVSVFSKNRDAFITATLEKGDIVAVYDLTEDQDVTSRYLGMNTPEEQKSRTSTPRETTGSEPGGGFGGVTHSANLQDVVYLKNGSVIRGVIIEQIPNVSLKIQMVDGSIFNYTIGEVLKITKEPAIRSAVSLRSEKSPALAFVLSFILTGAGQFYNGDVVKGVIQLGGAIAGLAMFFENVDRRSTRQTASTGALIALGCSVWSMIDAPIAASAINEERRNQGALSMTIRPHWDKPELAEHTSPDIMLRFQLVLPF